MTDTMANSTTEKEKEHQESVKHLHNMYNASSEGDKSGEVEPYEYWLERQFVALQAAALQLEELVINQPMEKETLRAIRKYVYKWLMAICKGREMSGHDFFSGMPDEMRKGNGNHNQLIYYALYYVSKCGNRSNKETYYSWFKQKPDEIHEQPWASGDSAYPQYHLWRVMIEIEKPAVK